MGRHASKKRTSNHPIKSRMRNVTLRRYFPNLCRYDPEPFKSSMVDNMLHSLWHGDIRHDGRENGHFHPRKLVMHDWHYIFICMTRWKMQRPKKVMLCSSGFFSHHGKTAIKGYYYYISYITGIPYLWLNGFRIKFL